MLIHDVIAALVAFQLFIFLDLTGVNTMWVRVSMPMISLLSRHSLSRCGNSKRVLADRGKRVAELENDLLPENLVMVHINAFGISGCIILCVATDDRSISIALIGVISC